MNTSYLVAHRSKLVSTGQELLRICEIDVATTSELQRQICGAFLFGMAYSYGKSNSLNPPDVQALGILLFQDVLSYAAAQAGSFSETLVQAARRGPNDTMNAIIHRGIDGYSQFISGQHIQLRENLLGIFQQLSAFEKPKFPE